MHPVVSCKLQLKTLPAKKIGFRTAHVPEDGPLSVRLLLAEHGDQVDVVHVAVLPHLHPLARAAALSAALVGRRPLVAVPAPAAAAVVVVLAGHRVAEALDGLGDSDAGGDGAAALLVPLRAPVGIAN